MAFREVRLSNNRLLAAGIIGSIISALCCFTPILVILFAAVGISALIVYVDIVALPLLALFLLLTAYALWKRRAS